jgi:hypothetical protein
MSLSELRQSMMDRLDWAPSQSADFIRRLDGFINAAYQRLHSDAPDLLVGEGSVAVEPDVESNSAKQQDRVSCTSGFSGSPLVVQRSNLTALGNQSWNFSGLWHGRKIQITRPSGRVIYRTILDMWRVPMGGGIGGYTEYISLDEPMPDTSEVDMLYRIYWEEYPIEAKYREIRSARVWDESVGRTIMVVAPDVMAGYHQADRSLNTSDVPMAISKGQPMSLRAPNDPPEATESSETWDGPERPGTFEIVYTLCWGTTGHKTRQGFDVPRLESSPSALVEATATDFTDPAILITTPNIDYSMGFWRGALSGVEDEHCGFYKRFYARRKTVTPVGVMPTTFTPALPETHGHFYLIGQSEGHEEEFEWQGARIDVSEKMEYQRSYNTIQVWPPVSVACTIRFQAVIRPDRLVEDTEAPMLDDLAREVLVEGAMRLFYESDGKAELAEQRYVVLLANAKAAARGTRTKTRLGLPSRASGAMIKGAVPSKVFRTGT